MIIQTTLNQNEYLHETQNVKDNMQLIKQFKKELYANGCCHYFIKRPTKIVKIKNKKKTISNGMMVYSAKSIRLKINDKTYICSHVLFQNSKIFNRYLYLNVIDGNLKKWKLNDIENVEILDAEPYEIWS